MMPFPVCEEHPRAPPVGAVARARHIHMVVVKTASTNNTGAEAERVVLSPLFSTAST